MKFSNFHPNWQNDKKWLHSPLPRTGFGFIFAQRRDPLLDTTPEINQVGWINRGRIPHPYGVVLSRWAFSIASLMAGNLRIWSQCTHPQNTQDSFQNIGFDMGSHGFVNESTGFVNESTGFDIGFRYSITKFDNSITNHQIFNNSISDFNKLDNGLSSIR